MSSCVACFLLFTESLNLFRIITALSACFGLLCVVTLALACCLHRRYGFGKKEKKKKFRRKFNED